MKLVQLLPWSAGCLLVLGGCPGDGTDNSDTGDDVVAEDARLDAEPGAADAATGNPLNSTLTATCATLQGRAVVNENGNLGVAFTESGGAFTFIGSIQWDLPSGFTGALPNPENWDGISERHVLAVTSPTFELFGTHCWSNDAPPVQPGSGLVQTFNPSAGIVTSTFTNVMLHSCTGSGTCTINGSIETTGEGVFQ